jgi:hypothetical protein
MGEALDFENKYGIPDWNRSGKIKKQNFSMTVTKQMKQQIKDLGGAIAIKHLIIEAHNKLQEKNNG